MKLKDPINELVNELKGPMAELNNMKLMQLNFLKNEVNSIIKNNVKNENQIQKNLDLLLDLVYWFGEDMEQLYYRLLVYYRKINFEVAKDYEKFYLEIINEEDDEEDE